MERHSIDGRLQFDGLTTSMRWPLQTGFAWFRSTRHLRRNGCKYLVGLSAQEGLRRKCRPISLSSSSLQYESSPRSGPLLENGIGFEGLIESSDETALGRLVICRQQECEQV